MLQVRSFFFAETTNDYRTARRPYAAPTHAAKSAQLTPIRNHVLSNNELYFPSNIVCSPLASIDDRSSLSLVNTQRNLSKFHSGIRRNFFPGSLTICDLHRPGSSLLWRFRSEPAIGTTLGALDRYSDHFCRVVRRRLRWSSRP